MKSIRNIRAQFREKGVFYTPEALALRLKSYIDGEPGEVYDPTCGAGGLLKVFGDGVKKYGQEIDADELALIGVPNFTGYAGDTLMDDGFKGRKFECIVANPPFSIKWSPDALACDERFKECGTLPPPSKADWAFMLHILHHLKEDGTAVVLEHPGVLYRGQREYKIRKWFLERNYIERVASVPGGTFEDTAIATCIIVLKKNRTDGSIIFEDERQCGKVSLNEIAENDYALTPQTYLPPEEIFEKPEDPARLQEEARQSTIFSLKKDLEIDRMICELENMSQEPYLDELTAAVNGFRQ